MRGVKGYVIALKGLGTLAEVRPEMTEDKPQPALRVLLQGIQYAKAIGLIEPILDADLPGMLTFDVLTGTDADPVDLRISLQHAFDHIAHIDNSL